LNFSIKFTYQKRNDHDFSTSNRWNFCNYGSSNSYVSSHYNSFISSEQIPWCHVGRGKDWELHPALKFLTRCFGAQATLCGTILLSTKMEKISFQVFAASIVPFLFFDFIAWKKDMLTLFGAVGDGIGNIIFLVGSYLAIKDL
jgi:hypothetical protein